MIVLPGYGRDLLAAFVTLSTAEAAGQILLKYHDKIHMHGWTIHRVSFDLVPQADHRRRDPKMWYAAFAKREIIK